MSEKKMTRQIALENVIAFLRDNEQYGDNWSEEIEVLDNMLAQIYKQQMRPKSKSAARIQNEPIAREFVKVLAKEGQPLSAKDMTYRVRYCTTSQKAVAIAKIAEEWGAIEKVTIKNRVFYRLNPDFIIPSGW